MNETEPDSAPAHIVAKSLQLVGEDGRSSVFMMPLAHGGAQLTISDEFGAGIDMVVQNGRPVITIRPAGGSPPRLIIAQDRNDDSGNFSIMFCNAAGEPVKTMRVESSDL